MEMELPDVRQVHLLSSCNGFIPAVDAGDIVHDMQPDLATAGVTHLCADCPDVDTCGPHRALKELRELAAKNGLLVTFTTVCCATRTRPRKRLLQIIEQDEPKHS